MQINLHHVQKNQDNEWLLHDILDAIQHQAPEAFAAATRLAGGLNTWLNEQELKTLLNAHSNELAKKKKQTDQAERLRTKEASQVLYAYDKANPNTKWAVGRTTLDHEQMTFSKEQFKIWVQRQLERKDITVSQREDLLAANFWLAKAPTIIITNGI
ncbi:TPA: hypothetical protein GRI77_19710 [Vibrio parahaemolyticus]|uniref:hypothetical protein n=1 Tax=Vibrio parahaemolyticus TaxID=670 RepID=UPI0007A001B9|nr:hypothetical protein [Vibrio parahaemolyticus]EGQ9353230.1 hypothetical protein [Vibrio parahaemolyticus]EGQ9515698.1 hypothetical protein [Vibrio parahaemolyticus]EIM7931154.1 hypothetical protein [Vibrio parahaemolyticus]EJQ8019129.1 hypothetical protein [Vibrio parahaemolyticus]EJU8977724.1 hypothetical protein [Vibrio parahaemolyticus]